MKLCIDMICEAPKMLFDSDKFIISLKAPIMELLLQQDGLCLEEIVIWDKLMKWALAQHPTIPKDVTKWNSEEVIIMKNTLNPYIPLVRFHYISSENFHDKVYPFKKILPKDLVKTF